MEREGHYVAVGAFIVLVLAVGGYWLSWLTADNRAYQRYSMYFQGSVMGLSNGSSVTYMGVNVGRVTHISVDRSSPGLVQVLVDIQESTPILPTTEATLAMRGVTGLVIIELSQAEEYAGDAVEFRYDMQGNREIPVKASLISEFARSLPDLSAQISLVLGRLSELLNEKNLGRVETTLENLDSLTGSLANQTQHIPEVLSAFREVAVDLRQTSGVVRQLVSEVRPQTTEVMSNITDAAKKLDKIASDVDAIVQHNSPKINDFIGNGLGDLQQLISESRDMVNALQSLADSLKNDPSQLIYTETTKGVELK